MYKHCAFEFLAPDSEEEEKKLIFEHSFTEKKKFPPTNDSSNICHTLHHIHMRNLQEKKKHFSFLDMLFLYQMKLTRTGQEREFMHL